jgi:hypothetical protein
VVELEARRTLVKSPPELWSELSDPATLARLLEERFGAIAITRATPETSLEWASAECSGRVELEPSGWGTKVRITAQLGGTAAAVDEAETTLERVLDEVGSAHHRPFSR